MSIQTGLISNDSFNYLQLTSYVILLHKLTVLIKPSANNLRYRADTILLTSEEWAIPAVATELMMEFHMRE